MPGTFHAASLFLITTLFDLYLFILAVRLILVYVGAGYYDPITQFVVKFTDFAIKPLRRILPNINRIELATVVFIIILESIKFLLISLVSIGIPSPVGLILLASGDFLKLVIQTFFYAILLQAILSWVQPFSPMSRTLSQFVSPVMQPLHRIIPPVGGIDISPIFALIGLQLLNILIVSPLMGMGIQLAF